MTSRSRPHAELAARIARRSVEEFVDDHCGHFAASISYHVLFSLFPLAIVLTAVLGIVIRATDVQADLIDAIVAGLPLSDSGAADLRRLLRRATGDLSTFGLIGIAGLLYSASGMMSAIRTAVNAAFDVEKPRPFLRGKLIDVGLVVIAAVATTASLASIVAVRVLGDRPHATVQVDFGGGWTSWVLGIAVPLAFSFAIAFGLYRFIPAIPVRTRHAAAVALGVACGFVLLENLFALYVRNFADYNAIYGSLGAIVAFMFFVYLASMLLLLGAEVTSEWPRAVRDRDRGRR